MNRKETLVEKYFKLGLQQSEILLFLHRVHNVKISQRTLKRILSKLNLCRRKNYTPIQTIVTFLQQELEKAGQLHGYRWMHLRCLQNGFVVTQNVIRELLSLLDPEGVDFRTRRRLRRRRYYSKGPNFMWHMDSYDKLKRYGICINGCIDGFSRHIIWLRVGRTSSDPKIIAGYYLNAVRALGGCPTTIRSDLGTENKCVEKLQTAFCEIFKPATNGHNPHNRPPFLYGRSTANQRIESWWSILRKHNAQYWINTFDILKNEGLFDGSHLDKSLIQFCFMEIIQNDLNEVVFEWNTHKVRRSRNTNAPTGRPMCLFEVPELYNAENCLTKVPEFVIDIVEEDECRYEEQICDEDVINLSKCIIEENGYVKNNDVYDGINLYIRLRTEITHLLNQI